MRHYLTDKTVKAIRPPEGGSVEVWDTALPRFGLRVTAGGVRTWFVRYAVAGRKRRKALGRYPVVTLADACRRAGAILDEVDDGRDPDAIAAPAVLAPVTVKELFDLYCDIGPAGRHKRAERTRARIERHILPRHGLTRVEELTRRDLAVDLDRLAQRAPYEANRVFAAWRGAFRWALGRGYIDANPIAGMSSPAAEDSRDRVLTDAELAAVWNGAGPWPFGPIVRLLILTLARREEVAGLRWAEINFEERLIEKPRDTMKARRPHVIPLSPPALDLLRDLPRHLHSEYVFPSARRAADANAADGHFSGYSKALGLLHARSDTAAWSLHDLRRTGATRIEGPPISTPPHVTSALLGHAAESSRGVTATYARYQYLDEKRAALDAWAARVIGLAEEARRRVAG